MKMSARDQILQGKCKAGKAFRQTIKPPLPVHCAILISGQDIEVSAIFESWIYDGSNEDQNVDFPSR